MLYIKNIELQNKNQMIQSHEKMMRVSKFKPLMTERSQPQDKILPKFSLFKKIKTLERQSIGTYNRKLNRPFEASIKNFICNITKERSSFQKQFHVETQKMQKLGRKTQLKTRNFKMTHIEKENIKISLRNSLCELKKKDNRVSQKQQKNLHISFNKKLRELKLRKFAKKDEQYDFVTTSKYETTGATIKGDKHSVNQDSLVFSDSVFIICDGHGSNGKQISEFVANFSHKLFLEALNEHHIDQQILTNILKKVENQLQYSQYDISFSGCTFLAVIIFENTVYCVSVGDSRGLMCKGISLSEISTMHKPDSPIERERIESYGGVIHPIEISKDKFAGPNRIWAPGKNSWGPGLSLSRAFGDKAARKYGVIAVPDIKLFPLSLEEDFIVLGSDGLYDYLKDQQISFFIRKIHRDENVKKQDYAQYLCKESKSKGGESCDDISCILIMFDGR